MTNQEWKDKIDRLKKDFERRVAADPTVEVRMYERMFARDIRAAMLYRLKVAGPVN